MRGKQKRVIRLQYDQETVSRKNDLAFFFFLSFSLSLCSKPPVAHLFKKKKKKKKSADLEVARLRAELEALSYRTAEDLDAEEAAFAEAARSAAAEGALVRAEIAELERSCGGVGGGGGTESFSPPLGGGADKKKHRNSAFSLAPAAASLLGPAREVAARLGAAERVSSRAEDAAEVIRTLAALADLSLLAAGGSGGGGDKEQGAAAAAALMPEPLRSAAVAAFSSSSSSSMQQQQQQSQSMDSLAEAARRARRALSVAREAAAAEASAPQATARWPSNAHDSLANFALYAMASARISVGRCVEGRRRVADRPSACATGFETSSDVTRRTKSQGGGPTGSQ